MLNKRLRKQIEWHFYNYEADKNLQSSTAREIAESGLIMEYGSAKGGGGKISNPTESKGILLSECDKHGDWARVVENTYNHFKFEPEYEIMIARYIIKKDLKLMFSEGLSERTYFYWRDRWLELAYMWARKYKLL